MLVGEPAVLLVAPAGCLSSGRSRGSWIDSADDDDEHLAQARRAGPASRTIRAEPRVERQRGELCGRAAVSRLRGSVAVGVDRAAAPRAAATPSVIWRRVRRLDEREARRCRRGRATVICRMTEARLVRRISGSVNSGRAVEVLLGVEPDADAVGDAAAAARPAGWRWPARSARSAAAAPWCAGCSARCAPCRGRRRSGCRHGQRGLGDVGGQHDPPPGVRREDPVLLGGGQPRVQRQHLGVAAASGRSRRVGGVADLALARRGRRGRRRRPSVHSSSTASHDRRSTWSRSSPPGRPARRAGGSGPRPGRCGRRPR